MTQPDYDLVVGPGSGDAAVGARSRRDRGGGRGLRPGMVPGVLLVATFVAIAVAAALTFVGLPFVVMSPGPATNILGETDGKPLLAVEGASTYPTSGSLDFTTVSVTGGPGVRVTVYDLIGAWLSDADDALPVEQVFPPEASQEQVEEEGAAEMAGSQSVATASALRAVGREVDETVVIGSVLEDGPSQGVFEPGDVLVTVDGDAATSADAVRAAVRRHAPGDTFPVVVVRDGAERTVTARTAESDGATVIGVGLRMDYDLLVDVTLNTGRVGGPSAGLMFSLAIYDVLTPGELTGGKNIAGTGTMEDDGTVGPIGGIRQKLVGAQRAGADYFLAPAENCSEVVGHVPDGLEVLRVATFDDGLAAVNGIAAGDVSSLPTCG